jgi:hypothetical protein
MTTLFLEKQHYNGDVGVGFQIKPEIYEWCETNIKSKWILELDREFSEESPMIVYRNDGNDISISFNFSYQTIRPAIEFEDENDLIHFKMRWFG